MDEATGRRIYAAIEQALVGGELSAEELAQRVGCTPHDLVEVLLHHDRASRITITPGANATELLVRVAD